ncbi:MAG: succinate CoA transferase [Verrucomicrobiae bacterium]|nr:succinate CoA transferase [Verrucomicrobiae bacterium]
MSTVTKLTAAEAARLINDNETLAVSGFTAAGAPKVVPLAIARRAEQEHAAGRPFKVNVISGASTGRSLDGALAKAKAIGFRTPYQSDPDLRKSINAGETRFFDMHLSRLPQDVRYGFLGPIHLAVIEACEVTKYGEIVLTSSVGAAPTFCNQAEKIVVELNRYHPNFLRGVHDIFEPENPPQRSDIPVFRPSDRIGQPVIQVDPAKIVGVVETNLPDETNAFPPVGETTARIGNNVAEFLAAEVKRGLIPAAFLPVQSGVGDTANAVLMALADHPGIPNFQMYTEVIQDAVIALMQKGRVTFASGSSLTVPATTLEGMYKDWAYFRSRLLLRPQEITNNPEVVRRIGTISVNTALEVDLSGNVNSTHVLGRNMMNGIGGSADFARAAFLSIFICPSTAKAGTISTIVPMVSHLDSSEHSVSIVVTEQGIADLRGRAPRERARLIIENCVHPDYRPLLREYAARGGSGHTLQSLGDAFKMHLAFGATGDMRQTKWG